MTVGSQMVCWVVLAFCTLTNTANAQEKSNSKRWSREAVAGFENYAAAIVRIRTTVGAELDRKDPLKLKLRYYFSTGFFVGEGLIATTAHSVRDRNKAPEGHREVAILGRNSRRYVPASVVCQDTISDLALIRVNPRGIPGANTLSLSKKTISIGERVYGLGIRSQAAEDLFELMLVAGQVTNPGVALQELLKDSAKKQLRWIPFSAMILDGHSGGPLVNASGEVVGVIVAMKVERGEWRDYSLAIAAENLISMLRTQKFDRETDDAQNRL